jgi:hypothetical protein
MLRVGNPHANMRPGVHKTGKTPSNQAAARAWKAIRRIWEIAEGSVAKKVSWRKLSVADNLGKFTYRIARADIFCQ